MAISSKKLCSYIVKSKKSLLDFFLYDQTQFTRPSMSEHLIREEVNAKIKEAMRRQKHTLVSTLHEKISSKLDLPSIEELLSCSREEPLEWNPVFRRVPGQSHRSFQEQNKAFKLIKRKLHLQLQGKAPTHGCLVGPPGHCISSRASNVNWRITSSQNVVPQCESIKVFTSTCRC